MASNLHLQQNVMTRYLTRVDCCNLENISMYLIHRFFYYDTSNTSIYACDASNDAIHRCVNYFCHPYS
jgi:hypothetical protein